MVAEALSILALGAQAPARLPKLTDRQLAGQRIAEGFGGRTPPAGLLRRIRRGEVAGVILFSRNVGSDGQVRALVARLQREPRPAELRSPLLVFVDQEGGLVKRLPGPPTRSHLQIGSTRSARVARSQGSATGRYLRRLGINVDLAPVLDVGRPGSFQRSIGRTFSADHRVVERLGGAFTRGLIAGGVQATLKHFPGLGMVRGNQDDREQRVTTPLRTLRRVHIAPFGAGIKAGARLVMTSSAVYTGLDRRPGLLSRRVVTGELRRRLRFGGVIVTDDLDVAGIRRRGGPATLAPAAAGAGNDLLLFSTGGGSAEAARAALVKGLRSRRLDRGEFEVSVRRVLALRVATGRSGSARFRVGSAARAARSAARAASR